MRVYIEYTPTKQRKELTDSQLAAICLNLAGGGYTEEQTAQAMQIQERLTREPVSYKYDKAGKYRVFSEA